MKNNQRKWYGIKFPFTDEESAGFYVDLDKNYHNSVKSGLMHALLTRKGTRCRMPDFGSNLLNFLFNPKDTITKSDILMDINACIKKYYPNITATNVSIDEENYANDNHEAIVTIDYTVDEGIYTTTDKIVITV